MEKIKLSICMATYMRGSFIAETLDSIAPQLIKGVELIILDGASPDNTEEVVASYVSRNPRIKYIRADINSGVDQDYDKAVSYASGDYCWLMTDDDLLVPGAIERVLRLIAENPDLIVVNSKVMTADLKGLLSTAILPLDGLTCYTELESDRFFAETASYLSFIGCVVIRRALWGKRQRSKYYGTLFIHVGVIFQDLLNLALVIREPQIIIRYGNAMWTSRGFEIWMFKWPKLVWSFKKYSNLTKNSVCPRYPWKSIKNLVLYRALGGYGLSEYGQYIRINSSHMRRLISYVIALFPESVLNFAASFYCIFINKKALFGLYSLSISKYSTYISRHFAQRLLKDIPRK
ncbi:glycosyltransferase family 2 protein [Polynucleobacter sp. AM-25C3]|uniref:glycosyltransferase family 2 protein n=1 Tax=Polynucleobacter sp. AM-25C3 TaxID=1855569 RepID=UPI001C0BCA06|nr:glycosyltransferase family 2 protein [Polynucleobacter sp. AM-25C3]MBU3601782.1 glycosyltransferase family 2 protein [Polynucleobacter sp. AM-25C3]